MLSPESSAKPRRRYSRRTERRLRYTSTGILLPDGTDGRSRYARRYRRL